MMVLQTTDHAFSTTNYYGFILCTGQDLICKDERQFGPLLHAKAIATQDCLFLSLAKPNRTDWHCVGPCPQAPAISHPVTASFQ